LQTDSVAQQLLSGESIKVDVGGSELVILPEEVEVRIQAKEGFAVASEGAYLAALVTDLTPELENEGLAREFVRRVQDLRKKAEFDIADRIDVFFQATPKLGAAIMQFKEYISMETLAKTLTSASAFVGMQTSDDEFDGETVKIGIRKLA
jgi:isoleucyl-tRNA synthetase